VLTQPSTCRIHLPHGLGPSWTCPQTGYSRTAALLAQLVEHLHGKEGVDGSSPSEGSVNQAVSGASARWWRPCGKQMWQADDVKARCLHSQTSEERRQWNRSSAVDGHSSAVSSAFLASLRQLGLV
jgi:hypothetical protein